MKVLRTVIAIFLGFLTITVVAEFLLTPQTDLPMIVVVGAVDGHNGIYRINPYDHSIEKIFDASTWQIQIPGNRALTYAYHKNDAIINVINLRNPNASRTLEVSYSSSFNSASPTGEWLLYLEREDQWFLKAYNTNPRGRQKFIPLDLSPGIRHIALWPDSDKIIFGSMSSPTSIYYIDLLTGANKKIGHGRLVLYTNDTFSAPVYRGKFVVSDETGCLTLFNLNDNSETIIFDDRTCRRFRLLEINPDWVVYSEATENGQSISRFSLKTEQTEEILSTTDDFSIAYVSRDGSLLVLQESFPALRADVFTLDGGLVPIDYNFDGSTRIIYETGWFSLFDAVQQSSIKTYELIHDTEKWYVQPVDSEQLEYFDMPTEQRWIIAQKSDDDWFLKDNNTGNTYSLNATIVPGTQFSILEFDVPTKTRRNLTYVTFGLAALLFLSKFWLQ